MRIRRHGSVLTALALVALALPAAGAETKPERPRSGILSLPAPGAESRPAALRDVAFDQRLGEDVPLALVFKNEKGEEVRLGDLLSDRPAVLLLAYYGCPMLCPLAIEGLARALKPVKLDAGNEFDVIVASFDPKDTPEQAAARKEEAIKRYGRDGAEAGWHFLVGSQASIAALTKAVGYRYKWDDESQQFAHPAGVVVLTPEGSISRYLFGLDPAPRDLQLALVESSKNQIGTAVDQLLLLCFHYDPANGRYSAAAMNAVRLAGALTVGGLGFFIGGALWRERRRKNGARA